MHTFFSLFTKFWACPKGDGGGGVVDPPPSIFDMEGGGGRRGDPTLPIFDNAGYDD